MPHLIWVSEADEVLSVLHAGVLALADPLLPALFDIMGSDADTFVLCPASCDIAC